MRRILVVGPTPLGPWRPQDAIEHVPDVATAVAHLSEHGADAVVLRSGPAIGQDVEAVQAMKHHGVPTIVVGPRGDLSRAREVILAGAQDYLELEDIDRTTLPLTVECAIAAQAAHVRHDAEVNDQYERTWMDRDRTLRQALIDQLADRLHNPMTVLMLQAHLMRREVAPKANAHLDRLVEAAERIRATVLEVTDAYRAQAGHMEIVLSDVDLWETHTRSRQATTDIHVDWHEHGGPLVARTDARQVQRIMTAMLRQAGRIAPAGSKIHVHLRKEGADAVYTVTVHDPTTQDDPARMLEAFASMEDLQTSGDLGLALYMSRISAQELQGGLSAFGSPGGAVFTLRLPRGLQAGILVIERDAAWHEECRQAARRDGLQTKVVIVGAWEEAQRHLHGQVPQQTYVGQPADIPAGVLLGLLQRRGWPVAPLTAWLDATLARTQDDSTA